MVLAADGLHPSFGGVSVMAWNLYTFLLELRRPSFADWQDYASPSPARETQQEPTFAQATVQTEPSRHLDLDWPPLTNVTSPNLATGPHPPNSLEATPAGGATAIPEGPAPQPEVLPPRRPRKQSASPEAHQVEPDHQDPSHPSYVSDDEGVPALAPPQSSDGEMDARLPSYPQRAHPRQHRSNPCQG
ncbi:hypothetical protein HPB48_001308 [Haemaphysalis longicornis]|uniref:Uncharacterized protein n=1 Tax=Haemaphysalis longicornis TaxID=44386 RepID=A0A9J6GQZ1_HAELO|nr:hypothetical protein HPB48_001308 [Haemaphysalis longicornis]